MCCILSDFIIHIGHECVMHYWKLVHIYGQFILGFFFYIDLQ